MVKNEKNKNLKEEPKQENKKKLTIVKFKIGNNKEKIKIKNKIENKQEQKQINPEKVKINFNKKRILSSRMTIKND